MTIELGLGAIREMETFPVEPHREPQGDAAWPEGWPPRNTVDQAPPDTDQGHEATGQDTKQRRVEAATAASIITVEATVLPAGENPHVSIVPSWQVIRPSRSSGAYDGRSSGGLGYPPGTYY